MALLATILSCSSPKQENLAEEYIEVESPFSDLIYFRVKDNVWIRRPENIMTVHETLKLGFYQNYIQQEFLDSEPLANGDIHFKTSLRKKIENLVNTYPNPEPAEKYYREFWLRRRSEKNDSTVHLVLTEFLEIANGKPATIRKELVSQKLNEMIKIVTDWEDLDSLKALSHFDFLRKEQMHQSANNLLYENFNYSEIDLNRDSLEKTLIKKKVNLDKLNSKNYFIEDNTK